MKKQITTEKNQRLDKILVNEFANLSRNQIEHLIKEYGVVINNKKIFKPAYKLEEGENVFVD
jgi:predicted rRNA methylase YqxC with S4 and FtsJ domains